MREVRAIHATLPAYFIVTYAFFWCSAYLLTVLAARTCDELGWGRYTTQPVINNEVLAHDLDKRMILSDIVFD
jgi:hypothetical protein